MRVLLVDDENEVLEVLSEILEDLGHTVTCKTEGEEALRAALKEPHDLVITDFRMPGMDGLRLLESLRDHLLDVPVILTAASGSDRTVTRALEAGAAACLKKPLRLKELIGVIQSLDSGGASGSAGSG